MQLSKTTVTDIKKYTFVKDAKMGMGVVKIFYVVKGKTLSKSISYRCTPTRLICVLEKIKRETGYYKTKEEHIKKGYYDVEDKEESYVVVSADEKDVKR